MRLDITPAGSSSGGGYSTVEEDGTPLTQRTTINFTGAGATATDSGGKTVVNIPGAAGASWTEAEIDFGTLPVYTARFTITDAGSVVASKIIVSESGKAATGRVAGDAEWDNISVSALPAVGTFTVYAVANPGPVVGKRIIHYSIAS